MISSRKKVFLLGAISNYGSSIISIIVGLITVPIGLKYFGIVKFGIWSIITSLLGYLSLSTLGLDTTTSTLTANTIKKEDQKLVLKKSFLLILSISFILSLIIILIFILIPNWVNLLGKIPKDFLAESSLALFFSSILYILNMPLGIFTAGFIGMQEQHWAKFYDSLRTVAGLVSIILVVFLKENLVSLAIWRGLFIIFISLISLIHYMIKHKDILRIRLNKDINNKAMSYKQILISGFGFLLIGIAATVVWNTDNLVISHLIGASSVTPYAVSFKLYSVVFAIYTSINIALFPMFGKASATKDWNWIIKTYNYILEIMPVLGGLIWLGGLAFIKNIIYIWTGSNTYGGTLLVFSLGGYGYLLSMVNLNSYLLIGLNKIKNMVYIGWAEAIFNIILSIFFVKIWGIGGAALGTFCASFLTVSWMLPIEIKKRTSNSIVFNYKSVVMHFILILAPCLSTVLIIDEYINNSFLRFILKIVILVFYIILSLVIKPKEVKKDIYNFLKFQMRIKK